MYPKINFTWGKSVVTHICALATRFCGSLFVTLGWKKKKVLEIKEELKRLGLGAHGKKAELVACLEEHLSTELSRAEPSNTEPNNG